MSAPDKPAPPIVGKVTANSIELYWDQPIKEDLSGGRFRYCIQEEEEDTRKGFGNVYNGFAKNNVFKGLEQNSTYRYRLRISNDHGHSPWSQVITVTTTMDIHVVAFIVHCIWIKLEFGKIFQERGKLEYLEKNLSEQRREPTTKSNAGHIGGSGENIVDSPDAFGMSPLMIASQKGYTSIVSSLIAHNADVNYCNTSGKNSMMLACFGGHLKVAIQLHEHGALLDTRDKGGSGCLHWAVDGGKPDCIQWLLDNGIQVDIEDDFGCSPLTRLASMNGNVMVAKILIENGADVNKVDKIKKSALMAAALNGNLSLVELLVENRANIYAENEYGKTAADFAESFGRKEVMSFLQSLMKHRSSTGVDSEIRSEQTR